MPNVNTNVFTGADGSITLGPSAGKEGEAAKAVMDNFSLITVGRVRDVSVQVQSEVHAFHELGQRYASELRAGNVNVTGTIGRAYINGALLRLILGAANDDRGTSNWPAPTFNITLIAQNAAKAGTSSTVTLYDVKLSNWVLTVPEDDFLLESVGFQALRISVEDKAE
jgi:hypothetical protein